MKKIPIQNKENSKRATVTFRSFRPSNIKSEIQNTDEFNQRIKKHKYPSLVRFKKLDNCSEQQKNQDSSSGKQENNENDQIDDSKQIFKGRCSRKNFTQYTSRNEQCHQRSIQKKKTMIPIKIRSQKWDEDKRSMTKSRSFKSSSKVGQKKDVENLSLKSINSKYSKLRRQVSSLWSIPTKKYLNYNLSRSPSKILLKQKSQLVQLELQFRQIIRFFKQEGQKKKILCQLNQIIKKQLQNQKKPQLKLMSMIFKQQLQTNFLFTEIPLNEYIYQQNIKNSQAISSQIQNSFLGIRNQERYKKIDFQINKINRNQNQIKLKIEKLKQEILMVRKDRVMYSSLFKSLEKELKNQQENFAQILRQKWIALGLNIDFKVGSNQQKLKTLVLKKYYQTNISAENNNILFENSTDFLNSHNQKNMYNLKKQQSGMQDTINLIKSYNSFSYAHIFCNNEQEKLHVFRNNSQNLLIKPRKQISVHQNQKNQLKKIQQKQIFHIEKIQESIKRIALKLQIKINSKSSITNKQESIRKNIFNSSACFNNISLYQLNKIENSLKFKQLQSSLNIKQKIKQFIDPLKKEYYNQFQMNNIISQIIFKHNSLQKYNDCYYKKIAQNEKQIMFFQQKIEKQMKNLKKRMDEIRYQEGKQKQDQFYQIEQRDSQLKQGLLNESDLNQIAYFQLIQVASFQLNTMDIGGEKQCDFIYTSDKQDINRLLLTFVDNLQTSYRQLLWKGSIEEQMIKQKNKNNQIYQQQDPQIINKQNSFDLSFSKNKISHQLDSLKQQQNVTLKLNVKSSLEKQYTQEQNDKYQDNSLKNQRVQINSCDNESFSLNQQKLHIRHSKGISTIIQNMSVFESYEKAMERLDFENQYKKELINGKKKKKTLIKKPIGYNNLLFKKQ